MTYKTKGTCSTLIDIEMEPDQHTIKSVAFTGGCNGNLKGISSLVVGMKAEDAIARLKGIKCGFKPTSCADPARPRAGRNRAGAVIFTTESNFEEIPS